MARIDGRAADQLRPVEIIPNINQFAEGSCLIRCGSTHVLCCASVEQRALVELCAKGIRELQNIQRQVLGG